MPESTTPGGEGATPTTPTTVPAGSGAGTGTPPQATTAPAGSGTRTEHNDDDALVRSLRTESAARRRENSTLTQSLTEAQTKAAEAERERDALKLRLAENSVREALSDKVAALKTPHTKTILALVPVSEIQLDADGKPKADSLEAALAKVRESHPTLFSATAGASRSSATDAGARTEGTGSSHATINDAIRRAAGRGR